MLSFPQSLYMAQMEGYINQTGSLINKNTSNSREYKQFFSNLAQYICSIDPNIESININVEINMKDGTSY